MLLWASLSVAGLSASAPIARAKTPRAPKSLGPTSDPARGAWGWTSGEQTYLRVRPSKNDPIVARVPHATKVFVWGKYNGWYRVETVDHMFGWVFHDFLNCPKAAKVAPLTHAKAVAASNRASSQTLYGSTASLQSYYGRHHASGAARGLAQHGVRLAASPAEVARKAAASKAAATRRAQLASARARASKPAIRLASSPSMISGAGRARATRIATSQGSVQNSGTRASANSGLRLASADLPLERPSEMRGERAEQSSQPPRMTSGAHFEVRPSSRDYSSTAPAPRRQSDQAPQFSGAASAQGSNAAGAAAGAIVLDLPTPRPQAPRAAAPRASAPRTASPRTATPRTATPRTATPRTATPRTATSNKPSPRLEEPRPVAPLASVPRVASAPKKAIAPKKVAPPTIRMVQAPAIAPSVSAPIAEPAAQATVKLASKPAAKAVAKPASKQITAAQARARARQQRRAWLARQQQERRNRRLASRGSSRDRLRSRMGAAKLAGKGVPPLSPTQTRPITPEELMRARESHIAGSSQTPNTRAEAPASIGDSLYPGSGSSNRDLSPRSDAGLEIGGAWLSAVSYARNSASRSRSVDDTRLAAPQDGPDGSGASSSYSYTVEPRAFSTPSPAPAASRSGSPRSRLLAGRAGASQGASQLASRPKANVLASRGAGVGRRGGSPRDAYAAQRKASGSQFGQTMASQAMSYRGTPYRSGGASPSGFDCSGLVYFLLRQRGFNPPRTAAGLASFGVPVAKNQLQAGDIVLFANTYKRGVSHVGIYQGEGLFVHAPHSGSRVRTDALFSGYYNAKYWGARRPK